jgi:hypothetical protein
MTTVSAISTDNSLYNINDNKEIKEKINYIIENTDKIIENNRNKFKEVQDTNQFMIFNSENNNKNNKIKYARFKENVLLSKNNNDNYVNIVDKTTGIINHDSIEVILSFISDFIRTSTNQNIFIIINSKYYQINYEKFKSIYDQDKDKFNIKNEENIRYTINTFYEFFFNIINKNIQNIDEEKNIKYNKLISMIFIYLNQGMTAIFLFYIIKLFNFAVNQNKSFYINIIIDFDNIKIYKISNFKQQVNTDIDSCLAYNKCIYNIVYGELDDDNNINIYTFIYPDNGNIVETSFDKNLILITEHSSEYSYKGNLDKATLEILQSIQSIQSEKIIFVNIN